MIRIIKPFLILLILNFWNPNSLRSQNYNMFDSNYNIDSNNTKILFLNINNLNFFKNNEFHGENSFGYTLPGFYICPTISYQPNNRINIEIGANLIRFYGAEKYPFLTYSGLSQWKAEKYQYGFHITPFYRAEMKLIDNLNIVFGNLYRNNNHGLISPMYDKELNYSSDLEEGLQILYNSKYIDIDTWLNWENFIFKGNSNSEIFSIGISSRINIIDNKNSNLYIPISFIGKHIGGEGDSSITHEKENWINYNLGIGYGYKIKDKYFNKIGLEINMLNSEHKLKTYYPLGFGRGLYSNLFAYSKDLELELGYWTSKDYVPILGNNLFGNISKQNETYVFDNTNMIFLNLEYKLIYQEDYCFGLDFQYYYTFPNIRKSVLLEYPKHNNGVSSFSFGIYLRLNPKIRIKKLNID